MTEELVVTILTEVFYTTFLIILPILGVSLIVGIFISIFQAATSIQEMTLTFVPKILITAVTIILLLPWMMDKMISLTTRLINMFSTVIR
ncbi:MAG: flagellar biosynthetic protein FliQ [Bacteroidota bacterium]|nr:flagellar biosynthetic protein FliQ [Bacteroidota bacterium]MDP4190388.1 flagellar biosynthetic protein FliQ [Bacteroidota bacterium]MDP4195327.1 flagellar biosynthetic protein FliQ [Bacteroidota bacterium]